MVAGYCQVDFGVGLLGKFDLTIAGNSRVWPGEK